MVLSVTTVEGNLRTGRSPLIEGSKNVWLAHPRITVSVSLHSATSSIYQENKFFFFYGRSHRLHKEILPTMITLQCSWLSLLLLFYLTNALLPSSSRVVSYSGRGSSDSISKTLATHFPVSSPSIGFELGKEEKIPRDAAWRQRFQELVEYKQNHGHCKVPRKKSVYSQLGSWVNTQRQNKRKGTLAVERQNFLDEIGFEWGKTEEEIPQKFIWMQRFQQLVEYKQTHGDCKVPRQYSVNPQLGSWVMTQRRNKQTERLDFERQAQLDLIGFEWGKEERIPLETAWRQRFQQLVEYEQAHGDCRVPRQYDVNPQLGSWVNTQRWNKRTGSYGVERQAQLDSIGFKWGKEEEETPQAAWRQRFQQLVEYKQTHGDCNVPHAYSVNPQLGFWVAEQRQKKRKGTLRNERHAQLYSIGFEEAIHRAAWGQRFQQLVEYKQTHGDCKVRYQYSVNPQLGRWVNTQRWSKRKGTLGVKRQRQLNSIGFEWGKEIEETPQAAWGQRFQQLVDYKKTHGDCRVPHQSRKQQQYNVSPQLGFWVAIQRRNKRTGSLGVERQAQLDSIGFEWGKEEEISRGTAWQHLTTLQ
jgi:hypothetical protein